MQKVLVLWSGKMMFNHLNHVCSSQNSAGTGDLAFHLSLQPAHHFSLLTPLVALGSLQL